MASIIVAYDESRAIGLKNDLPWVPIKEDWTHFKLVTLNGTVIMGRKTWESLPKRPLKSRTNIVVSRTLTELSDAFVCKSLAEAVAKAGSHAFIIGGAEIYRQAIEQNLVNRVIASEIKGVHEADVFFPKLGEEWKQSEPVDYGEFKVVEYRR